MIGIPIRARRQPSRINGTWRKATRACTTIGAICRGPPGGADLGQERDRIERATIAQPRLHGRNHLRMRQRPLLGRDSHFPPSPRFSFSLNEGWKKLT